jgi:hypothetical protein
MRHLAGKSSNVSKAMQRQLENHNPRVGGSSPSSGMQSPGKLGGLCSTPNAEYLLRCRLGRSYGGVASIEAADRHAAVATTRCVSCGTAISGPCRETWSVVPDIPDNRRHFLCTRSSSVGRACRSFAPVAGAESAGCVTRRTSTSQLPRRWHGWTSWTGYALGCRGGSSDFAPIATSRLRCVQPVTRS